MDDDWNSFVYVYNGKAKIANKSLNSGQLGVLSDSGIVDLLGTTSFFILLQYYVYSTVTLFTTTIK